LGQRHACAKGSCVGRGGEQMQRHSHVDLVLNAAIRPVERNP